MEQIGYSLVDASGNEVQVFGDTKGMLHGIPAVLAMPNGDHVHGAEVGDTLGDWYLVGRWLSDAPPSPWHKSIGKTAAFDGEKIVVTVNYEEAASIVPPTVTPRQARLALLGANLLDQVEATVNAAGGATKITWDYATEINRTDHLIVGIGASLSLTSEQIDDLFRQASTL